MRNGLLELRKNDLEILLRGIAAIEEDRAEGRNRRSLAAAPNARDGEAAMKLSPMMRRGRQSRGARSHPRLEGEGAVPGGNDVSTDSMRATWRIQASRAGELRRGRSPDRISERIVGIAHQVPAHIQHQSTAWYSARWN